MHSIVLYEYILVCVFKTKVSGLALDVKSFVFRRKSAFFEKSLASFFIIPNLSLDFDHTYAKAVF